MPYLINFLTNIIYKSLKINPNEYKSNDKQWLLL